MCEWVRGGRGVLTEQDSRRFIKRKKFDDELVESSLAKSSTRAKGASGVEPGRCSGSEPSSSEKKKVSDCKGAGARFCISPPPLPARKSPAEETCEKFQWPQPQPQLPPLWEPISSPYSPFLAATPLHTHTPCQCVLYHILCGRHRACIYSGSRQPVPSIAGCKNNPQVALLWP